MSKLTSMHFYAWKSGLKTGMYYLRTKSAVDAIKFTVKKKLEEKKITESNKIKENTPIVPVEPLSPEELKSMLSKSEQSQDDDWLMCGS